MREDVGGWRWVVGILSCFMRNSVCAGVSDEEGYVLTWQLFLGIKSAMELLQASPFYKGKEGCV